MHNHCSDVVIHLDDELADDAIHALERNLSFVPGVYCACVNDRARHLMLVDYDPEGVRAGELLNVVRRQGFGAVLVGL
ncbi:MAG: heavy-metal-associated domain-containing protein [Chromatiaceae bacterium]|nr:heavy-metal-associated domain-containing protein [Gammaproteobacteria bacterium]MCP5298274.1 heavy-metal-associated domain-containing protein [Chromatiaceae bacterium]MCP5423186.1 heavy-metal-associated domain-containing protein [Chromatiaceae bacterium]